MQPAPVHDYRVFTGPLMCIGGRAGRQSGTHEKGRPAVISIVCSRHYRTHEWKRMGRRLCTLRLLLLNGCYWGTLKYLVVFDGARDYLRCDYLKRGVIRILMCPHRTQLFIQISSVRNAVPGLKQTNKKTMCAGICQCFPFVVCVQRYGRGRKVTTRQIAGHCSLFFLSHTYNN